MENAKAQFVEFAGIYGAKAKALAGDVKARSVAAAKDRKIQVTAASAAGGTVTLGCCGGALGLVAGGGLGAVVGIPFVLFTFGLSIPFCAVIGGGVGSVAGATVGGAAGCATGGTAGYTAFAWRSEIAQFVSRIKSKVLSVTHELRVQAGVKASGVYSFTCAKVLAAKELAVKKACEGGTAAKTRASELMAFSVKVAQEPRAQVSAASATAGGVTLGAGGGAVGLAVGGLTGAAVGVVPALFTFGLSIPIGAVIGGGTGLCLGTVVGGATGFVGGGTAGYGIYGKRVEIYAGSARCVNFVREKIFGAAAAPTTTKEASPSRTPADPLTLKRPRSDSRQ